MKDRQYRAPGPGHKSYDKSHMLPKFLNLRIKKKKKEYALGRTNSCLKRKQKMETDTGRNVRAA